jgi:hypothetical protein
MMKTRQPKRSASAQLLAPVVATIGALFAAVVASLNPQQPLIGNRRERRHGASNEYLLRK